MGLIRVADDQIAAVVTYLDMPQRPRPRPLPTSHLRLVPWPHPASTAYRTLFTRVGAPWLWFSRLALGEAALRTILDDARVKVFAVVDRMGIEVGMLELDFRERGICDIAYFGLVPELAGQGHGRWLMALTLARAWTTDVVRVTVHTCTLDHPAALGFYRAQGFVPVRRAVETFGDPRVAGYLPRHAAPQVPVLAAS